MMRNTMLAVLMVAGLVAAQIPTAGLVARYDFTGGSLVSSGGNTRTLLTTAVDGGSIIMPVLVADMDLTPNNAYRWSRTETTDAFRGRDEGLPVGGSDRTICFWLSLSGKGDSAQQILSWGSLGKTGTTLGSFRIVFRYDTLCLMQNQIRSAKTKVTNAQFPALGSYNEPWTHVAVTVSGTEIRWYINGTLHSTTSFTGLATVVDTNTYLFVGRESGRYLTGKLDEILIYNRALTATEVNNIYDPKVSTVTEKIVRGQVPITHCAKKYTLDGRTIQATEKAWIVSSQRLIAR